MNVSINVSTSTVNSVNREPNVPISNSGTSGSNARVSECFNKRKRVDTDPAPFDDSPLSLIVPTKDQSTHEIDITSAAIERSRVFKCLTEEFSEEIKTGKKRVYLPCSAEAMENYLNNTGQSLPDTLSENELLDLIHIADYLQDDTLIRDAISMLKRRIAQFTKEDCFALIGSVQSYSQSGGIMKVEELLMGHLNSMHRSDEEILNVFTDLAGRLGDLRKSITILYLRGAKVSSETLKALAELFPNVNKLDISYTAVTEIPPGLWANLETLDAVGSFLNSIKELEETKIKKLDISGSPKVTEIPSGSWANLETLRASDCTSLASIKGLENTGIKKLDISYTAVTEIPSGSWANLETLDAEDCISLVSIKGLENTGIKRLDISGIGVTEIPSGPWKKLETLYAEGCISLVSIKGLENTGIKELNIFGTGVTEIPSGPWKKLETLYASDCESLTSIKGLENTGIKELNISSTAVTEIPSGPWKKLETLRAEDCKSLTSIKGLEETEIKELNISSTAVTEIPLGPWANLKTLDASYCESLEFIDALKRTGITEIDISGSDRVTTSFDGWQRGVTIATFMRRFLF